MGGQHHIPLNDHVGGFILGVEEHLVFRGIRDVRGITGEDAAVVRHGAVSSIGVRNPVELAIDKVDAASFVAGI